MINLNKYYISTEYQGASGGSEGRSGFVPKALSGDELKFLRGDGTWREVVSQIPLVFTELSTYTLSLSNQSDLITINNSLTSFVYIPNDSSVNFGGGSQINITRLGSGTVTVSASPGVTLRSADNRNQLRTQNSTATIVKLSANDWLLFGDIS